MKIINLLPSLLSVVLATKCIHTGDTCCSELGAFKICNKELKWKSMSCPPLMQCVLLKEGHAVCQHIKQFVNPVETVNPTLIEAQPTNDVNLLKKREIINPNISATEAEPVKKDAVSVKSPKTSKKAKKSRKTKFRKPKAAPSKSANSTTAAAVESTESNLDGDVLPDSVLITEKEFQDAVIASGYSKPSTEQYNNLVKSAQSKGGISTKRELAMFLAEILWESDGLRAKKEIRCESNNCAGEYQHPALDVAGKFYFGRGYIQLTWSYNYADASKDLYGDKNILLQNPEKVEEDKIAWETAFWFWKKRVAGAPGVKEGKFGAATNAINGGLECVGGPNPKAMKRFEKYTQILKAFNINEKANPEGCNR